jgi:hypothetical protein
VILLAQRVRFAYCLAARAGLVVMALEGSILILPALVFRRILSHNVFVILSFVFPCITLTAGKSAVAEQSVSVQDRAQESFGRLPLAFESNDGQASAEVRYLARGANYMLLIGDADAVLARRRLEPCAVPARGAHGAKARCGMENDIFNLQLLGTRAGGRINGTARGEEMLPGKVNTLLGNDPSKWHTGAATYRRMRVPEVYPGIDMVYYGDQQRLEYDFDVAPGADPKAIRFRFTGGRLRLNREGDLVATVKGRDVIFRRPVIY